MEKTNEENKKVTVRTAPDFGYQLANNLSSQLEKENIPPIRWPAKFPATIKQITKLPEINKNIKIARKAVQAAKAIWKDMRERAIEIEKDMKLHPEYYDIVEDVEFDEQAHLNESAWRHLSIEIEQAAGNIFVTEFGNEDMAKTNVYKLLSTVNLKNYILEFEDDYENFINEIRELIRAKKEILPSIRLELICMLHTNTKAARKKIKNK